jgi:hypothetical protein
MPSAAIPAGTEATSRRSQSARMTAAPSSSLRSSHAISRPGPLACGERSGLPHKPVQVAQLAEPLEEPSPVARTEQVDGGGHSLPRLSALFRPAGGGQGTPHGARVFRFQPPTEVRGARRGLRLLPERDGCGDSAGPVDAPAGAGPDARLAGRGSAVIARDTLPGSGDDLPRLVRRCLPLAGGHASHRHGELTRLLPEGRCCATNRAHRAQRAHGARNCRSGHVALMAVRAKTGLHPRI